MKNLYRSATLSSWFFLASRLIILLFTTTLIIKKFDVGEIALWYLYASVQAFAHLFDVGFSTTIIRYTAYNNASADKTILEEGFQKLYNSMNTVFLGLSLLVTVFLFVIGVVSVYPVIEENHISNGLLSFFLIMSILPINFFLKKNDAFLKGLNKISLYNNWNAIMYFVSGLFTIVVLYLDQPFYIVVLVSQLGLLVNSIKNAFLLKNELGFKIDFYKFSFNKEIILEYWKPTWKSALISFSSNGMNNLTNIIVPNFFSIELVASYLFSMRLIQFVNEFSWAPFYSQIPKFITEFKSGSIRVLSKQSFKRLDISLALAVVGIFVLGVSANLLMPLFDTKTTFIDTQLVGYIMIMIAFERFVAMHSQVIMFSNNIEHYKQYLIFSAIYAGLLYFCLPVIGLYGIAIAYILAAIFPLIIILNRSLKLMQVTAKDYFYNNLLKVGLLCLICFSVLILI